MDNRRAILPFLAFFFTGLNLPAQTAKTIYPHGVFWSKTELNQIFDSGWGVGLDFVYRRKNEMNTGSIFKLPMRESIRPWIHYQFSPVARLSLSPIGYMNTNEFIGNPEDYLRPDFHEWRSTLQFFHHIKQLNGRIMHTWRYRHELRWQEQPGSDDYRFFQRIRLRYRIRYMINSEDFYTNNTLYAAVSNEIGINMGPSVVYNIFNQNRFYAGIGYRFLNAARVELRYINQFRSRRSGFEYDFSQGFMVGLYVDQISILGKKDIPPVRFTD